MSTPGRRRALRALGRARRKNLRRVARGQSPIVKGKKVSARRLGLSKAKARKRLKARGRKW